MLPLYESGTLPNELIQRGGGDGGSRTPKAGQGSPWFKHGAVTNLLAPPEEMLCGAGDSNPYPRLGKPRCCRITPAPRTDFVGSHREA